MAQSISNTTKKRNGLIVSGTGKNASAFNSGIPSTRAPKLTNPRGIDLSGVSVSGGNVTTPSVQRPATSNASATGLGSYKGVPITGTDEASIIRQIREIDGQNSAVPAPSQASSKATTGKTKGLLAPPKVQKQAEPATFSSMVGDLSQASKNRSTQEKLIRSIERTAAGNQSIGRDARQISEGYADEIARVGKLGAGANAGLMSTGTSVVGSGNSAITSQSVSQRIAALADAQQAALEGTAQQLTGQQQTADAFNQALTGANVQQGNTISGLGTAASLAVPSPAGFGQTTFDPLTGQFGGGQGNMLEPQIAAMQLAEQVRSGSMTYDQAVASLGYAGGAGQQFLNQALQAGGGFNVAQSQANLQGQIDVLKGLPAMEGADVAAEGIKNKINAYLADNPQLNPADLAVGNKLQQWIQGKQLTDPKYQTLFNYLNEYTSTLAPILGVGGETTNLKTQIAQEFINAAASGASMSEVLENIQALSRGKIQDLRSGTLGGGSISNPVAGGGTGSGGLFDW